MERLTKRDEYGFAYIRSTDVIDMEELYDEAIEKLANYEDAEEQGRMIIFPCKIGDTTFFVDDANHRVIPQVAMDYSLGKYSNMPYIHVEPEYYPNQTFPADFFGVSVFLTREEAEAKLAEMEAQNEQINET